MLKEKIEKYLLSVQKPARYIGGEAGSIYKDKSKVDVRFAFCFPDCYDIGMSHLGMKILYALTNQRENYWCERVFAPWPDFEQIMREHDIPLYGLESLEPIRDFDFIGFTLQYELSYTNILNMLDLAGVPVYAKDRGTAIAPLVVAGGPCACNPEPLADFFDLFILGEGEEVNLELMDLYYRMRQEGADRQAFLRAAARIEGIYVPSLYEVTYHPDGTIQAVTPKDGAPATVKKRIIRDFDKVFYPDNFVVPFTEIVQDRVSVEVLRGCIRGCRFCQAGFLYRPFREKSAETVYGESKALCENTGYDEVSLSSLSTSDHSQIDPMLRKLLTYTEEEKINLSLPSLRIDNFSEEVMNQIKRVRKSGLTFAPEAGTQRLRDAINKNLTEEDLHRSLRTAFSGGWNSVKLYFMLGLPTETDEDVIGIAELVYKILQVWRENGNGKKRGLSINLALVFYVTKPFTPFQWAAQITPEEYLRRVHLLQANLHAKCVDYRYHESDLSRLEAVMARGDRRVGKALLEAHNLGCRLDGWDEYFDYEKWLEAFRRAGLDPDFYTTRGYGVDELLPWQTIDVGVTTNFLLREREKALRAESTPDCRTHCNGCGARRLSERGLCDESPAV